eukprot:XP_025007235.1 gamma-synuclein isoform X2 [Gallus gallus]
MTKGLVQPRLCPAARCAPGLPAARGEAAASGTLRRPRSDERKAAEGGGAARTALTQQTRLPGGAGLSQRALGPGGAARAAPAAAGRSLRRATPCAGTRLKSKPVGRRVPGRRGSAGAAAVSGCTCWAARREVGTRCGRGCILRLTPREAADAPSIPAGVRGQVPKPRKA